MREELAALARDAREDVEPDELARRAIRSGLRSESAAEIRREAASAAYPEPAADEEHVDEGHPEEGREERRRLAAAIEAAEADGIAALASARGGSRPSDASASESRRLLTLARGEEAARARQVFLDQRRDVAVPRRAGLLAEHHDDDARAAALRRGDEVVARHADIAGLHAVDARQRAEELVGGIERAALPGEALRAEGGVALGEVDLEGGGRALPCRARW